MIKICPTIDAFDVHEYREQMSRVRPFAEQVHIDVMDGEFVPVKSPELAHVWWPHEWQADLHLMCKRPMDYLVELVRLKPRMVIVHAEAEVHHMHFCAELHKHGIHTGIAILQETPVVNIKQIMHSFDQVLIFSGHLGYQGGDIDLDLLHKVHEVKEYYPEIEIAWDGGINDTNARQLIEAGVSVLDVGGFIQKSGNPEAAYATLKAITNSRRA